jgi:lipopolysaccharide export system protein LptA
MNARDIDLDYTEDGSALERVVMTGRGSITLKTENGSSRRRIAGESLDLALAPDGSVTHAVGAGGVQLDLPAAAGTPSRIIRAMTLDAAGEPGKGLTSARFVTNVEYREDGGGNPGRVARSDSLQVTLTNDVLSGALFRGRVRFEEQTLQARAARAAYAPEAGMLGLEGSDASGGPRVSDERINVDADAIDVTLDGHAMTATGTLKTTLRAATAASSTNASSGDSATRLPGLFRQEQPVNASARSLDYKGASGAAVYTGDATLWQGDTAIRADTIVLDQQKGNLTATGAARSTLALAEGASTGRAVEIRYDDAARQLSYASAAPMLSQLTGPQGDLRAGRIELVLKDGGRGAERLEAYNNVTARIDKRVATGARLTYVAEDQRYVMTGAAAVPVKLVEDCRETTGKTLIFFKSTDRIIVDGNEEIRTETSRGAPCSAPRVREGRNHHWRSDQTS